jgi:phage tail-like protein
LYAECENCGTVQLNVKNGYVRSGVMYSGIFDSLYPETQWHRITIDAQIGKDCSLGIEYFAWNPDPEQTLITRKINPVWIPLCNVQGSDQIQPDSLINNVRSRFIVFKISLFGNGESSPQIKKIRITFPHRSYLRYLPAVYQDDPIGRDITDRFLSIFEAFNMEIEEQIATIFRLFDPQSTNEEFLSWLGSWLGILRDENWSEKQFRDLLSQSYQLFKIRGTSDCLKKMLSIYTGADITIIEHYQYRRPMVLGADTYVGITTVVGRKFNQPLVLEESSTIGDFLLIEEVEPPETPFLADAYDFTVIVNMPDPQEKQIACIRRLIEHEKPAHTRYCLRISGLGQPRIGTAMLGVDTKLTHAHTQMKIGSLQSVIGDSSKAGARYPVSGIYGNNLKIGIDTYLH